MVLSMSNQENQFTGKQAITGRNPKRKQSGIQRTILANTQVMSLPPIMGLATQVKTR
jgi:hypothetical protein